MIQDNKRKPVSIISTLLLFAYFCFQPWDIYAADIAWVGLSLTGLGYLIYTKSHGVNLTLPKELKVILWLFAAIPILSLLSYSLSPLDTLKPTLLEADSRWWLAIPTIILLTKLNISHQAIFTCLIIYSVSTFVSAFIETDYLSDLAKRADGDENAVPYGMFNATIALLIAAYFKSNYNGIVSSKTTGKIKFTLIAIAFLCSSASAFLSGTRAAIVLIPIGLVIIFALHFGAKKASLLVAASVTTLTLWVVASPESKLSQKITFSYTNVSNYFRSAEGYKNSSLGQRLDQWEESWCIFKLHPILGTGPRSFREAHLKYGGANYCNKLQTGWGAAHKGGSFQAHSVYFNTIATLGSAGVFIFLALFLALFKISRCYITKSDLNQKIGATLLTVSLTSLAINGLTLDLWFRIHIMDKNLIILILPLALIFSKEDLNKKIKPKANHAMNY